MLSTAIPDVPAVLPVLRTEASRDTRWLLHQRMLDTGYSSRDIAKVESALLSARLHDTYLRAGYSPDDIAAVTSLF